MRFRSFCCGLLFILVLPVACSHRPASPRPSANPVSGTVLFEGAVPPARKVSVPDSLAKFVSPGLSLQPYQVGTNGGLADVLVYIANPPEFHPAPSSVDEARLVISNTVCRPAFLALHTNQALRIQLQGGPPLNFQSVSSSGQNWNRALLPNTEAVVRFPLPDLKIRLTDSNVLWLVGRIAVFDHPWYTVTDAAGHFALPPLPPGDYTLEAVHRRSGRQTLPLHLTSQGTNLLIRMAAPLMANES